MLFSAHDFIGELQKIQALHHPPFLNIDDINRAVFIFGPITLYAGPTFERVGKLSRKEDFIKFLGMGRNSLGVRGGQNFFFGGGVAAPPSPTQMTPLPGGIFML